MDKKNEGEGSKTADKKYREAATDFARRTDTLQTGLEAERERIKAFNVSCRKGGRALTLLDEKQLATYLSVVRLCSYQLGKHGEFPSYHLANLSGDIGRNRKRLEQLQGRIS